MLSEKNYLCFTRICKKRGIWRRLFSFLGFGYALAVKRLSKLDLSKVDELQVLTCVIDNIPKKSQTSYDVYKNILYITATSKKNLNENDLIPQTTKREVFAHRLEDGTTEIGNGGLTILLSPETASSIEIMKEELCDIVEISLAKKGRTRKITSCYDENDKEFKGIIVSPRVLNEIEKGIIFNEIKDKFNVSLTIQKSNGKIQNVLKEKKYIKLASISW
jgi:hypothetical protein